MLKQKVYEEELKKLTELFNDVDPSKASLVEGLIKEAAFLFAENLEIRQLLDKTGMILVNPKDPKLQKPIPAAKEYRQNVNSYSVIIKTLNGILQKSGNDEDDDLDEFE